MDSDRKAVTQYLSDVWLLMQQEQTVIAQQAKEDSLGDAVRKKKEGQLNTKWRVQTGASDVRVPATAPCLTRDQTHAAPIKAQQLQNDYLKWRGIKNPKKIDKRSTSASDDDED